MLDIYAGITTYNPDIDRLKENIAAVLPQVQGLVVVDNFSDNINDIKELLKAIETEYDSVVVNIKLIENDKNMGVAHSLNQIIEYAVKNKAANWVLTLDQDTVVYDNLVKMYRDFILSGNYDNKMASLTCLRRDRNYEEKNRSGGASLECVKPYEEVKSCITSGNLISAEAWRKVRGFDGRLFIDMVDDEFCYRLRENGYKIVRINSFGYLHELGEHVRNVRFLWMHKTVLEYSPVRKFYTARNTVYMRRRFRLGLINEYSVYLLKRMVGTLLYEKKKLLGIRAYFKGIRAGKKLDCTK